MMNLNDTEIKQKVESSEVRNSRICPNKVTVLACSTYRGGEVTDNKCLTYGHMLNVPVKAVR